MGILQGEITITFAFLLRRVSLASQKRFASVGANFFLKPLKCQLQLQQTTVLNIFHCFSDKIMLDISCESSAWQRIHMKDQALFSSKDKSKIIKVSSAAILLGYQ